MRASPRGAEWRSALRCARAARLQCRASNRSLHRRGIVSECPEAVFARNFFHFFSHDLLSGPQPPAVVEPCSGVAGSTNGSHGAVSATFAPLTCARAAATGSNNDIVPRNDCQTKNQREQQSNKYCSLSLAHRGQNTGPSSINA